MNRSTKTYRWIVLVLSLVALPMTFTGCATNQPVGQQVDDAAITAAVKSKLAADTDVAAHNIDVDTLDGVVTLSGIVDSWEERTEAARLAADAEERGSRRQQSAGEEELGSWTVAGPVGAPARRRAPFPPAYAAGVSNRISVKSSRSRRRS